MSGLRCLTCGGDYLAEDDEGCAYCLQCRASVFVIATLTDPAP
jgi:hypothetical protein